MTAEQDVLAFVRELVDELKDHDDDITADTPLEALALDSLDYVQTQIEVRKRFGVVVDAELFASGRIVTVGDLCRHVATAPAGAPVRPAGSMAP